MRYVIRAWNDGPTEFSYRIIDRARLDCGANAESIGLVNFLFLWNQLRLFAFLFLWPSDTPVPQSSQEAAPRSSAKGAWIPNPHGRPFFHLTVSPVPRWCLAPVPDNSIPPHGNKYSILHVIFHASYYPFSSRKVVTLLSHPNFRQDRWFVIFTLDFGSQPNAGWLELRCGAYIVRDISVVQASASCWRGGNPESAICRYATVYWPRGQHQPPSGIGVRFDIRSIAQTVFPRVLEAKGPAEKRSPRSLESFDPVWDMGAFRRHNASQMLR